MGSIPKAMVTKAREIIVLGIRTEEGCLLWPGAKDVQGYGHTQFNGVRTRIHRFVALYCVERTEEQIVQLEKCSLTNTCEDKGCYEPTHWKFGSPPGPYESEADVRQKLVEAGLIAGY